MRAPQQPISPGLRACFVWLAGWFRLVYTVFLGVAAIFFFQVLQLLSRPDYMSVFDEAQLDAHALTALEAFNYTWLIGLLCFGIHLMLLGYLIIKSGYVSKVLGYVLMLAGGAYTIANALLSNYDQFETLLLVMVAVPSVVGELWLGLWLLFKVGRAQETALAAA